MPSTQGGAWIDPGPGLTDTVGEAVTHRQHGITITLTVVPGTPAQLFIRATGRTTGSIQLAVSNEPNRLNAIIASIRPSA